jgi:hypothetical protein
MAPMFGLLLQIQPARSEPEANSSHRDRIALADLRVRPQLLHWFKVAPISFSQEKVRYADRVFGNDTLVPSLDLTEIALFRNSDLK